MGAYAVCFTNAGVTFVRAVTSILQPLQQFSGSYVDDMAVGSFDWSAHVTHLRQFLATIRAAGLTLSLAKCEFARSEVRLLGALGGIWCEDGGSPAFECDCHHTQTYDQA